MAGTGTDAGAHAAANTYGSTVTDSRRTLLFRILGVLILAAIAGVMMVIGRGHTVFIDNKTFEYNGNTYPAYHKAVVYVDGEQVAKLAKRERGQSSCMGQKFTMTVVLTEEKDGPEKAKLITVPIPYNMDGVIINLPAFLAGLPEDQYIEEFVIQEVVEEEEEAPGAGDDMGLFTEESGEEGGGDAGQ